MYIEGTEKLVTAIIAVIYCAKVALSLSVLSYSAQLPTTHIAGLTHFSHRVLAKLLQSEA